MPTDLPRILVVDDEPRFRKLSAHLLTREGYEVEVASNTADALSWLGRRTFDLMIADIHMPGEWGLALLEQDAVPVLMITGDPSVQTAVEALRGAAVDYMTKPLSPELFLARVAEGLARSRAQRRLAKAELLLEAQLELVASLRSSLGREPGSSELSEPPPLPASIAADLSPREREVLSSFRASPRIAELARTLHISPHTVRNHLKAIYRKLGVSSQAELLALLAAAERRA